MRKQLGLSLVELMISITLGLVLMTGVVQMFLSSKVVFNNQQALSRIQETGRLAIDFISRDVRMAAYYGCFRITGQVGNILQPSAGLTIGGLHESFDQGIRGYDSPDDLPHGAATDLGATIDPVEDASVLVVRGGTQVGYVISGSSNNNLFAYSETAKDSDGCVGALCEKPGSVGLVADCSKARVFRINTLAVTGTTLTVNHLDLWSDFVSGEVLPMNTIVYFLATREGATVPSLWQKTNLEPAVELLEGVEKMRVTYATANGDGVLDQGYRLASALALNEWAQVVSVRLELVARSLEKNVLSEPQPYTFENEEINPGEADAADRSLRQVFTSVVTIRSRMTLN